MKRISFSPKNAALVQAAAAIAFPDDERGAAKLARFAMQALCGSIVQNGCLTLPVRVGKPFKAGRN